MSRSKREKELEKSIVHYLNLNRIFAFSTNAGNVFYTDPKTGGRYRIRALPKGTSDIIGWIPPHGRILAIECKDPLLKDPRPDPDQEYFLQRVIKDGGIGLVVNSLEMVLDGLRAEGVLR